ncbi:endonuclease domain-containing protein [Patescibacteria group bacterium]|nr:endonuclease domain-containing protein [Patescibacteria group bacterium]
MNYAPLHSNKKEFKYLRKSLRQDQTKAEQLIWAGLRKKRNGFKFRRQFQILNYIVDFYCNELRLIIEIDGYIHENDDHYNDDLIRQKELEKLGHKIIRYTNNQVYKQLESVWWDIKNKCEKRKTEILLFRK